jgi:ABC-2 type transport system permease protein
MNSAIIRQLVLADLYLLRWMILGAVAGGAASIAVIPLGRVPAYVGSVLLICALIILNIFLVMSGIVQERKDKVQVFLLSLPLSPMQYTGAKIASNAIGFLVPWLLLTAATLVMIRVSWIPDGTIPYFAAVLGYLLTYYCVLLAVGLVSDSTGWHAVVITCGNVSVNFLIAFLSSMPSVTLHRDGPVAIWTPDIVTLLVVEVALGAAAIGAGWYFRSRDTDFV